MATKFIQCGNCKKPVAKGVKRCPYCGAKLKSHGCLKSLLGLFLLAVIVMVAVPMIEDSARGKSLNLTNFQPSKALTAFKLKLDEPKTAAAMRTTAAPAQATKSPAQTAVPTEAPAQTAAPTEARAKTSGALVNGMRPEFKEAMDAYEAFFDEYAAFMEKFESSGNTASMLLDYAKYMSEYAETMEKLDAMGDEDLNDAELTYYLQVQTRVNKRLLEVAE